MLKKTLAAAVLATALAAAFVANAHDGCDEVPAGGKPVIHTTELLFDLKNDKLTMEALERLEDLGKKLAITDVETVIAIAPSQRLRPVVRDFLMAKGVSEDRFYFEENKRAGRRVKIEVIGRYKDGD